MKKAIVIILALLGLLAVVAVAALAGLGLLAAFSTERVPTGIVLEVDFEQGVIESIPDNPLAQVMLEDSLPLRNVVDALDRAAQGPGQDQLPPARRQLARPREVDDLDGGKGSASDPPR